MYYIEDYIRTLIQIYQYVLIAYVLLSWLPSARESFIGEILGKLCEPYLSVFRRFIPPIGGMIDISPIIALIALRFVGEGIVAVLRFIIP
ncbi:MULTISPECIES: YggT family protein [Paenibacillus]|uniref:YggT family protein n=1 Tax=Paenibacillus elgii TaxID=189691 RepID=A0A2T6G3Y9_9BACL|nr:MULTISPECIES: YggT family protein [Paenibacillus]MCM3267355.1 YggT family protein [Paenibacillus elgii]NEN83344.1 YggT family protein [Paenibacillus elgii]PUA38879.1 YggT family protein [Paenibacillus elgii]